MLTEGDRVIFTSPDAQLDGLRGQVCAVYPGGYYDVAFEDRQTWKKVWESKLEREVDYPDYPRPNPAPLLDTAAPLDTDSEKGHNAQDE